MNKFIILPGSENAIKSRPERNTRDRIRFTFTGPFFFQKKKFYELIQELREINPEDKKAHEYPPSLPEQEESRSCSKTVPKRPRGQEAHPEKETRGSRDMFTFCLLTHSHRTLTLFPEASPASKPPMLASKRNQRCTE